MKELKEKLKDETFVMFILYLVCVACWGIGVVMNYLGMGWVQVIPISISGIIMIVYAIIKW